jgi:hypothetical protein
MMNTDKGSKVCTGCKIEKPVEEFYLRKTGNIRRFSRCKDCIKKQNNELKREVLSHYSTNPPVCAMCGETELSKLCLDHVNGGGRAHMKSIGLYNKKKDKTQGGIIFYRWLKKNGYQNNPPLQVLCLPCNQVKQIINNER